MTMEIIDRRKKPKVSIKTLGVGDCFVEEKRGEEEGLLDGLNTYGIVIEREHACIKAVIWHYATKENILGVPLLAEYHENIQVIPLKGKIIFSNVNEEE